jgi:hypothetical protein
LYPSTEGGTRKDYIHTEVKSNREGDAKRYEECGGIGFQGIKAQVNYLLFEYMVVKDIKDENIQQRVSAPAGCIPECLQGHESPEQRIKEIDYRQDELANMMMYLFHECWRKYAFGKTG